MRHVFSPLIAALFLFLAASPLMLSSVALGALTTQSRVILDEAKRLGVETDAEAGLKALNALPRKDVVKALADGLKAGEPFAGDAAQAAAALPAPELIPDLKASAKKIDSWKVFAALRSLAKETDRADIEQIFLNRVKQVEAPSAVAILDTLGAWKFALPEPLLSSLLASPNQSVKRAALYQFISARAAYSEKQQVSHFADAFAMKPYQLRVDAMKTFLALPKTERVKLASAVEPLAKAQGCIKETKPEVKTVCVRLADSVKRESP